MPIPAKKKPRVFPGAQYRTLSGAAVDATIFSEENGGQEHYVLEIAYSEFLDDWYWVVISRKEYEKHWPKDQLFKDEVTLRYIVSATSEWGDRLRRS